MPIFTKEQLKLLLLLCCAFIAGSLILYLDKTNRNVYRFLHPRAETDLYSGKIKVAIYGAVKKPGEYSLAKGSRLKDLIEACEGLLEFAKKPSNVAFYLKDGKEYYIPFTKLRKGEKINLNKADSFMLTRLPYINKAMAEDIIKYRDKYKGFDSIDELKEIANIGDAKFEAIKEFVTLGD